MLDLVDTFGIEAKRFVGWHWLLGGESVGGKNMGSWLVVGLKGSIVVKVEKDGLDVAGY